MSPINASSWAYNPQVKPYTQNLDTAKSMYEKLKTANPQIDLSFILTTTPTYVDTAGQIIDAWKQIGVNAQLQIVAFPDTNEYQILLIGQQIPEDPDQYPLWHSTQSTNISHYQSPQIDKVLEDGRREMNREKRLEIYQNFQRFLVEDCPAVFMSQLPVYTISRGSK
jgi:peptide/nickel transport system substrate-binding protein